MRNPGIDNAILVTIFNIVEAQSALFMESQVLYFSLGLSNLPILIVSTLSKLKHPSSCISGKIWNR